MFPSFDNAPRLLLLSHCKELTSHISVIMLTAKADMQSKIEGLQKGAEAYLEKPFNKKELLVRIRKLLEMRKYLQQYYQKTAGIEEAVVSPVAQGMTITRKFGMTPQEWRGQSFSV